MSEGIPTAVAQALSDTTLSPVCRLAMWHIRRRLDHLSYQPVKVASLAAEMQVNERTLSDSLRRLVSDGYLDTDGNRRPRAYRLPTARLCRELLRPAV